MRKCDALVLGSALMLLCLSGSMALAQQEPEPAVPDESGQAPAVPADTPPEEKKFQIGLYVAFGGGLGSAETFNTSLLTEAARYAESEFELDELTNGRAAIGWRLPEGKGDFRLVFNGYKEESYKFHSLGAAAGLRGANMNAACTADSLREAFAHGVIGADELNASPGYVISPLGGACLYAWWDVSVKDGRLVSVRTPGGGTGAADIWTAGLDDLNGNSEPDPGEIVYLDPDRVIELTVPDNMQNAIVTWDALYGREFGGRRYSSRWWAGLRYFAYEGQMLAGAWLDRSAVAGAGFTDQAFLPLIGLSQESTGWGPMGSWEVDFNFFNKGLVFYLRGEMAFTFNQLEVDTGEFFTVVNTGASLLAPVRLHETRDKSSWQAAGEGGVRLRMRNGLEFELGYRPWSGYLDVALLPSTITIPAIEGQVKTNDPGNTISALYHTQDFKVDSWHGLVGFQF